MRSVGLVFACAVCVGHTRRLQVASDATRPAAPAEMMKLVRPDSSKVSQTGGLFRDIALALLAVNPSTGWLAPGPFSRNHAASSGNALMPTMAASSTEDNRKVLVAVADDSEEIETACITDVLVRAGAQVTLASVMADKQVKMSRGLKVVADVLIDEVKDMEFDAIAIPGGMPGATNLAASATLIDMLKKQQAQKKLTAAVCASPAVVFAAHGLLPASATCYPAPPFKEALGERLTEGSVIEDSGVITSQGPGTSLLFALKIVEALYDKEKADSIADAMLVKN